MEGLLITAAILTAILSTSISAYKIGKLEGEIKAQEEFIEMISRLRQKHEEEAE